ncbi:MAG TPA: spore germination protein [Bacillota bacterium]|nr:spore germination protein [Bacillota bacterium]
MPAINEEDSLYNKTADVSSDNIRSILGSNADFVSRVILVRNKPEIPSVLVYMDGLVDISLINDNILKPLSQEEQFDSCSGEEDAARLISMGKIYSSSMKLRTNMKDLTDDILAGSTALIFNDARTAFTFEAKAPLSRAISEPTGESVIKGAKDSFIED